MTSNLKRHRQLYNAEENKIGQDMLVQNKSHQEIATKLSRLKPSIKSHFTTKFFNELHFSTARALFADICDNSSLAASASVKREDNNHNHKHIDDLEIGDCVYVNVVDDKVWKHMKVIGWVVGKIQFIYVKEAEMQILIAEGEIPVLSDNDMVRRYSESSKNLFYYDGVDSKIYPSTSFSKNKYRNPMNNNNDIDILCICHEIMIKKKMSEFYPNYIPVGNDNDVIICNICQGEKRKQTGKKGKESVIYHCLKGKISVHSGGYNICQSCANMHLNAKRYQNSNIRIPFDEFKAKISNERNAVIKELKAMGFDAETIQNARLQAKQCQYTFCIKNKSKIVDDILELQSNKQYEPKLKLESKSNDIKTIIEISDDSDSDNEPIKLENSNKDNTNVMAMDVDVECSNITTMTIEQVLELKQNDVIDHRNDNGKWEISVIENCGNSKWDINEYNAIKIHHQESGTRTKEYVIATLKIYPNFAKPASVSKRSAHRLKNVKIGDVVYCKINNNNKWAKCIVQSIDCGQVQITNDEIDTYWIHLDNEQEICKHPPPASLSCNTYIMNHAIKTGAAAEQIEGKSRKKRRFEEMNPELNVMEHGQNKRRRHVHFHGMDDMIGVDVEEDPEINYDDDIKTMIMTNAEARTLKKGDMIDHQHRNGSRNGKYIEAKIIDKKNSDLRIRYINDNDQVWSDYETVFELKRFAKYKSISRRRAHRLSHVTVGDVVYLNMKIAFEAKEQFKALGWIKCIIEERDNMSGQIQLKFENCNDEIFYWIHLDHKDIINDDAEWVEKQMKSPRYINQYINKQVAFDQDYKCSCKSPSCLRKLSPFYEIDHIIPVCKGGTNDRRNLQALNPNCHRVKTNRDRLGVYNYNNNNDNDTQKEVVKLKEKEKEKVMLWLTQKCKLSHYYNTFIENGYDSMETIELGIEKDHFKEMNIKIGHQRKILQEIKILNQP